MLLTEDAPGTTNNFDQSTDKPKDIRFYRLIEIGGATAAFDDDLEMRRIESNGAFFQTLVGRALTQGDLVDVDELFPGFHGE